MSRQHAAPLLIDSSGSEARTLVSLSMTGEGDQRIDEAYLRDLIHAHPSMLPISEIDRQFEDAIPICTELPTDAGAIDVFLITPRGLPVLVECKLWRNPQARREVIGQILDYAKELSQWTSADVQRKVAQRLKRPGNALLDRLLEADSTINEVDFNDALTQNLRLGRFLLLIVGDGIREGTASIAQYVQDQAGARFTLGLVEIPIFLLPDGSRIVAPRVLARTETILRTVIALPDGLSVQDDDDDEEAGASASSESPDRRAGRMRRNAIRQGFWRDFLSGLRLDDPEQALPPAALGGHIVFKFGAPGGSSWLTVYRDMRHNAVGLSLSSNRNSPGERASQLLAAHREALRDELGPDVAIDFAPDRPIVSAELVVRDLEDPAERTAALDWLRRRTNDFINALRPRLRAALREIAED